MLQPIRQFRSLTILSFIVLLYLIGLSFLKIDDSSNLRIKKLSEHYNDSKNFFSAFKKLADYSSKSEQQDLENRIVEQYHEKIKNDKEDKFWILDSKLSSTKVNIPSYYFSDKEGENHHDIEMLQPYDPRFTLGVYIHNLKVKLLQAKEKKTLHKDIELPFHWYDWLDLSHLNKYLILPDSLKPGCEIVDVQTQYPQMSMNDKVDCKTIEYFCINDDQINPLETNQTARNKLRTGFQIFSSPGRSSSHITKIAGKSFLYSSAPPPISVIFLTEQGSYTFKTSVDSKKLLDSDLVDNYTRATNNKYIDPVFEFKSLISAIPPNETSSITSYEVNIPKSDFLFPYQSIIQDYEINNPNISKLPTHHLHYYHALKYSEQACANGGPPKYFSEARLLSSEPGSVFGDHYDWRFFDGISIGSKEQELVLHRMIRAWLSFCRSHGINTWIAHGSLLSWYWNGIAFPWDNDIDVQVPVMDLHRLSQLYNQTLIVENVSEGFGRYFLDCGTFITQRVIGNGNNKIDARFIDIDTGLYIDITGLSVTNTDTPDRYLKLLPSEFEGNALAKNHYLQAYNCRNNHFSTHEELSPLILTYVEGEAAYVPKAYADILSIEYEKGIVSDTFENYMFLPQLRLWIHKELLEGFAKNKTEWSEKNYDYISEDNGVRIDINKRDISEDIYGEIRTFNESDISKILSNDELFIEYFNSRSFTKFHEEEMLLLQSNVSTESLVKGKLFDPLKPDFFMFKIRNDFINYDESVANAAALLQLSQAAYENIDTEGDDLAGKNKAGSSSSLASISNSSPNSETENEINITLNEVVHESTHSQEYDHGADAKVESVEDGKVEKVDGDSQSANTENGEQKPDNAEKEQETHHSESEVTDIQSEVPVSESEFTDIQSEVPVSESEFTDIQSEVPVSDTESTNTKESIEPEAESDVSEKKVEDLAPLTVESVVQKDE